MQIGRIIILPWDKRNFIPRLVMICIAIGWVFFLTWGALLLRQEMQLEQQQVQQQQRLKEKARQRVLYQQSLQQQQQRNNVQNAIDGVKK